jgi:hypothetical protein
MYRPGGLAGELLKDDRPRDRAEVRAFCPRTRRSLAHAVDHVTQLGIDAFEMGDCLFDHGPNLSGPKPAPAASRCAGPAQRLALGPDDAWLACPLATCGITNL